MLARRSASWFARAVLWLMHSREGEGAQLLLPAVLLDPASVRLLELGFGGGKASDSPGESRIRSATWTTYNEEWWSSVG